MGSSRLAISPCSPAISVAALLSDQGQFSVAPNGADQPHTHYRKHGLESQLKIHLT